MGPHLAYLVSSHLSYLKEAIAGPPTSPRSRQAPVPHARPRGTNDSRPAKGYQAHTLSPPQTLRLAQAGEHACRLNGPCLPFHCLGVTWISLARIPRSCATISARRSSFPTWPHTVAQHPPLNWLAEAQVDVSQ